MTYENKIKKHRRQATIVNGQYQGVELATQLFQGKKAQAMLLEQKEQRCEDLRWTVQEIIKDLNTSWGETRNSAISKIQAMMEEIKELENEIGGNNYAYLIQHQ